MKLISTPAAPKPIGHYAQGVVAGGFVFASGQLPIDPVTNQGKTGSIEEQTEQVLKNIAAVLAAAGSSPDKVVKVTVYLSDMELRGRVNTVYAKFFGAHTPARATIPVGAFPSGFLIEIDAVAAL